MGFVNGKVSWVREQQSKKKVGGGDTLGSLGIYDDTEDSSQISFEPRGQPFRGSLANLLPRMQDVYALSNATHRSKNYRSERSMSMRGPKTWMRHQAPQRGGGTSAPPEPTWRSAGNASWNSTGERVVMALGQSEGDGAGGDNSAGGRRSVTAADRKQLLILNARASTPNTAQRASHTDHIYKTSPVAARPHSQMRHVLGQPTPPSLLYTLSGKASGNPTPGDHGFSPKHHTANIPQTGASPSRSRRLEMRMGTPSLQLTCNPLELRQPVRGGPNCTVEPLFLDGRSSFSPEFHLSKQLPMSHRLRASQEKAAWFAQVASGEGSSGGWYSRGALLDRITDERVSPALRHGRSDPTRTVKLRAIPLTRDVYGGEMLDSAPTYSRGGEDEPGFEPGMYQDSFGDRGGSAGGAERGGSTGEFNPSVPPRVAPDDLDMERAALLRRAEGLDAEAREPTRELFEMSGLREDESGTGGPAEDG